MISLAFVNDVMSQLRNIKGNSRVHVTAVAETRGADFSIHTTHFYNSYNSWNLGNCNGHAFAGKKNVRMKLNSFLEMSRPDKFEQGVLG
jgi:hypothetical protein